MVRDPFFHLWESNGWLHSLQNLAYNKITELTENRDNDCDERESGP